MKKLAAFFLATLALALVLIPPADAGCRRVVTPAVVVHDQAAVVVQPAVVATTFLQVPVATYPIYGATYGQGDTAAEVRALTAELARLRAALTPAGQKPATPPAAMPRADANATPPAPSTAPKVIAAACVRCHGATSPKGGVSLAGDVPLMTRLKAFRAVATGKMPPQPAAAVSDADLEELAKWSE